MSEGPNITQAEFPALKKIAWGEFRLLPLLFVMETCISIAKYSIPLQWECYSSGLAFLILKFSLVLSQNGLPANLLSRIDS
uniref:Uncharacterized protein n=1 Tax=Anguilla anguilla TaxID=7936 RepID=A0A0E9TLH6_ANGAN